MLGLGFAYLRSSPQTLSFLPKFQALAQRVLDDNRAINLILNTGFMKWSAPPLADGPAVVDGVARSGLRVALLPNSQVRSFCDGSDGQSIVGGSGGAFALHCRVPRSQRPDQRIEILKKYRAWLIREGYQYAEFPGTFEAWLDNILDSRLLDTRQRLFSVSAKGGLRGARPAF